MAEVPEKLSIGGELLDAIAAAATRHPDVALAIHHDVVFGARPGTRNPRSRPAGRISGCAPTLHQFPAVSNSSTAGAATQQSVRGGVWIAPISSGLISRGRFITQM